MSAAVPETRTMPPLRVPGALPDWGNTFIGRERLLTRLGDLAAEERVIAVTGAPGIGKTRLAQEFARRGPTKVVWVDVWRSPVEWMVPYSVSHALRSHQTEGPLLLVLDGCDRWQDAVDTVVERLLASNPELRCILTGRDPVGEVASLEVGRLEVPKIQNATPEVLLRNESGQLFLDRLRMWSPSFKLNRDTAPSVAEVCQMMEGIPLALELAASSLDQTHLARVRDRLGAEARKKSRQSVNPLAQMAEIIYEQLNEYEAVIYRQLGVFAGECRPLESALVATDQSSPEAVGLVSGLGRHAPVLQVRVDGHINVPQYIWEDSRERLRRAKEERAAGARHAHIFGGLAAEGDQNLTGVNAQTWIRVLEGERNNFWNALAWMMEQAPDAALDLVANLSWFWYSEGHVREGRDLIVLALSASERQDEVRRKALEGVARIAWRQQDYSAARGFLEESITLARQLGEWPAVALSLNDLGALSIELGDYPAAATALSESLSLMRSLGDRKGVALVLNNLGAMARYGGDRDQAAEFFRESYAEFKDLLGDVVGGGGRRALAG